MKTETFSKIIVRMLLLMVFFSSQSIFCQQQNTTNEKYDTDPNTTLIVCVLFFAVSFTILLILKIREDRKHKGQEKQFHHRPRRDYFGHGHQYHH
jgi:hypothetical protein